MFTVLLQTKGVPLFPCMDCSCAFKKLGSLNAHISKMHISVIEVPASTPVREQYAENTSLSCDTSSA